MRLNKSSAPFRFTADGECIEIKHTQMQRAMKSKDLFRDIFGLAVRLLGLVFLYLGLRAVTPMLDLGALETAGRSDIITAMLPVVFNLAVAWWLMGGGFLLRRAYPESSRISPRQDAPEEGVASATRPARSEGITDEDAADKKLARLVEKPKDSHVF